MKISFRMLLVICSVFLFISAAILHAQIFQKGIFLSVKEAEKKWESRSFNAEAFKKSNISVRASMAASIIKEKSLLGKTNVEIWKLLGRHDGYYFSDLIPAYVIEDNSMQGGDVWQIVFFLNRSDRVKTIRIHKNSSEY